MRARKSIVCIAAMLIAAPVVAGDPVYRSVMPDGRVLYGELPEPGAKQTTKMPAARASTGTIVVTPEEKQKFRPGEPRDGRGVVLQRPAGVNRQPLESGVFQSPPALPERRYRDAEGSVSPGQR